MRRRLYSDFRGGTVFGNRTAGARIAIARFGRRVTPSSGATVVMVVGDDVKLVPFEVVAHTPDPPYYRQALELRGAIILFRGIECTASIGDNFFVVIEFLSKYGP